jgi:hypothetical protein
MPEKAGATASAITARQAALASRHAAAAEADGSLSQMLSGAHAATVDAVGRLEAIAADIDPAAGFAVDTPLAARELQRYLIAKQRDIIAVVAEARDRNEADTARLASLRSAYRAAAAQA